MSILKPLGRIEPATWEHVEKYALRREMAVAMPSTPVTFGVNWYSAFDNPTQDRDGKWWVGRDGNLGYIRGGHCAMIPNDPKKHLTSWYKFYNQGEEGACVGFGLSQMMSMLNRKRYDARELWEMAKEVDEWNDTVRGDNNGTSVRAGADILRLHGHIPYTKKRVMKSGEGISANRWATNIDDLFSVLQNPLYTKLGAIPFTNSWGEDYPKLVWVTCEVWQRLMNEYGEFTMITDR